MVGICFFSGLVAYGAGRYSFGVFLKPMTEALGWSRTQMSLGATINLIFYATASPFVGRMMDTIGTKWAMFVGSVLVGIGLCAMYFCNSLWMFYLLYGVVAAVGVNLVGRIAQATIVANWFARRRGLMLGITALSIGLGTTVMAPAANAFLYSFGWQIAFLFLGGVFFVFVSIPVVLLIKGRGTPEERGFGPDGVPLDTEMGERTGETRGDHSSGWSVREALGTAALWAIFISMGLSYMADYVVLFHGVAAFEDRGLSSATAAAILAMGTLVSGVGRLGFGWLADRIDLKLCMALMFGVQIVAAPLIILGGSSAVMLYGFSIVWGVGYGGLATLMPAISGQYFGRRNFGAIYGWVTMATVFGGAIGSTFGGWIYDMRGSYNLAWYACVGMWLVAMAIILAFGRKPKRRARLKSA
jgi:MFS family permease